MWSNRGSINDLLIVASRFVLDTSDVIGVKIEYKKFTKPHFDARTGSSNANFQIWCHGDSMSWRQTF
jgi:hypothetical protein